MDYEIEEDNYYVKVFLDTFNKRIQVLDYDGPDIKGMVKRLDYLAEKNNFGKVFLKASSEDWEKFLYEGYILEGIFKYYYRGDNAYSLAKFFSQERRISYDIEDENEILKQAIETPQSVEVNTNLPEGYELRYATREDLGEIAAVYDKVFETYPIPLNQRMYLERLMDSDVFFMVITNQDKIVSVASADMNKNQLNCEMTDCATLPEERGKGLMSILIFALEEEMKKHNMICLFSLARAKSQGMNTVFHRHGYSYGGRLVKNCDIFGNYEDMNIWVKKLQ